MHRPDVVPPAPWVMAEIYEAYLQSGRIRELSFRQYLVEIGYANPAKDRPGMDDGKRWRPAAITSPEQAAITAPQLVSVPQKPVRGPVRMLVLLVDFEDAPGELPPSHYEELLFSRGRLATGSLADFYHEVSLGGVEVTGTVHGWLRMPESLAFYTNAQSGMEWNAYPRNATAMAEHAVRAAQEQGIAFDSSLDVLGDGVVSALFIVHAGPGAEVLSPALRGDAIWSHKWRIREPIRVADNLHALTYLTVPGDAKVGVCAHELGHLVFQWEDFYDPNYAEDGHEWDGAGSWDLMAGGSHNEGGVHPAHPACLHKIQHDWIEVKDVAETGSFVLPPFTPEQATALRVRSPAFRPDQFLLLENRAKVGSDVGLPGEGLLVWRVDLSRQMTSPDRPAMLLIQADGRHQLETSTDWSKGDAGDPFPGTTGRQYLTDSGNISTSFPDGGPSGISLCDIRFDAGSNTVSLTVEIPGSDRAAITSPEADPAAITSPEGGPKSGGRRDWKSGSKWGRG